MIFRRYRVCLLVLLGLLAVGTHLFPQSDPGEQRVDSANLLPEFVMDTHDAGLILFRRTDGDTYRRPAAISAPRLLRGGEDVPIPSGFVPVPLMVLDWYAVGDTVTFVQSADGLEPVVELEPGTQILVSGEGELTLLYGSVRLPGSDAGVTVRGGEIAVSTVGIRGTLERRRNRLTVTVDAGRVAVAGDGRARALMRSGDRREFICDPRYAGDSDRDDESENTARHDSFLQRYGAAVRRVVATGSLPEEMRRELLVEAEGYGADFAFAEQTSRRWPADPDLHRRYLTEAFWIAGVQKSVGSDR